MASIVPDGIDLERRGDEVAVEEVMVVLVDGDATKHLVAGGIVEVVAELDPGVAVRDAGGQLLERDVDEPFGRRRGLRNLTPADLGHPRSFELDRVEHAGHGDVVADHDRVTTLFGGPALGPDGPRLADPEHPVDLQVVVGQVVLGQQVDEQRTLERLRNVGATVGGGSELGHPVPRARDRGDTTRGSGRDAGPGARSPWA